MTALTEYDIAGLDRLAKEEGWPRYRARQIHRWIYEKGAESVAEMTDLPASFQQSFADRFTPRSITLIRLLRSEDGTEKALFRLEDGHRIESVLMFDEDRRTLCLSSQAGCAMGCRFCLTGRSGLKRNLRHYEIVEQALWARGRLRKDGMDLTNIVFMGMGEPFENFDEVREALLRLTSKEYMGLSKRRITVSTSGRVEGIDRLGEVGPVVNLAISLNATTNEQRDDLMPVNRAHPLEELLAACRRFPLPPTRKITFEYVLFSGVNDSDDDARRLIRLLKGIRSKVNLIPFNPWAGSEFKRPDDRRVLAFQKILVDAGLMAPIRKSKGADILAACGQLQAAGRDEPVTTISSS